MRRPHLQTTFASCSLLFTILTLVYPGKAHAIDPVAAVTRMGSVSQIFGYSMDIASDGRIFVALGVPGPNGRAIEIHRSDDGGLTWYFWSALATNGIDYTDPSLDIAEGDHDRLFVAYNLSWNGTGAILVSSHDLNAPTPSWSTVAVSENIETVPQQPQVKADDALRSDYGVFVAFAWNLEFNYDLGVVRSLDQGTSWSSPHHVFAGVSFNLQPDIAFGPDDTIQIAVRNLHAISVLHASNRAGSSSDWSDHVQITPNAYTAMYPQIVTRPGTDEVFALHSPVSETSVLIQRSNDGGETWSAFEDASEIPAVRNGEFELTPLGYRIVGYDGVGGLVTGDPLVPTDPVGSWNVRLIDTDFSTNHLYPVQLATDASHGGSSAVLAHRRVTGGEQLMFWADWFEQTAGVPDLTEVSRLTVCPNPATVEISLRTAGLTAGPAQLRVFDVAGRIVREQNVVLTSSDVSWDLRKQQGERVTDGVYLLELRRGAEHLGHSRVIVR